MSATPPISDAARTTHPKSGMPTSDTIEIKEITRVEGHGNLSVRIADGEITRLELQIVESPRFFESFVRGKRFDDVPQIVCRICGICSVAHTSAAVKAIEAAAGIVPTEQTILLRKLILFGEQIQSHVLHLYFLAVPDYLGVGSVIPLAKTHPEVVKRALRMKKLANDLCAVIGGRHIHPISYRVGGFSHLPAPSELQDIKSRLESARSDLDETIKLFEALSIPDYRRDTEYLAIRSADANEYAFYDGRLVSSLDASPTDPQDYRQRVIESSSPTRRPNTAARPCPKAMPSARWHASTSTPIGCIQSPIRPRSGSACSGRAATPSTTTPRNWSRRFTASSRPSSWPTVCSAILRRPSRSFDRRNSAAASESSRPRAER